MNKAIEITEAEFESQYPLLTNHLNPNASWVVNDDRGCLFETDGEEMEFVRQQDPRTVWTLVEDEIISGFHTVNRMGYLLSTVPVPEGTHVVVQFPRGELDTDDESDDETGE